MDASIQVLRKAVLEFPNHPKLMQRLGLSLALLGCKEHGARQLFKHGKIYSQYDLEYNAQNPLLSESAYILNKALSLGLDGKLRNETVTHLVKLYSWIGESEKALSLAQNQPDMEISKECLLPIACDGEVRIISYGKLLICVLQQLTRSVLGCITNNSELRNQSASTSYLSGVVAILEVIMNDGNFGILHHEMSLLYFLLSDLAAHNGDAEKALGSFSNAYTHKEAYQKLCNSGLFQYSSELVACVCSDTADWVRFPEKHLGFKASEELIAIASKDPRYKDLL